MPSGFIGFLESPLFALLVTLLLGAFAMSGKFSQHAAQLMLVGVWIVGSLAIIRSEVRDVRLIAGAILLLAGSCLLLSYWIRPSVTIAPVATPTVHGSLTGYAAAPAGDNGEDTIITAWGLILNSGDPTVLTGWKMRLILKDSREVYGESLRFQMPDTVVLGDGKGGKVVLPMTRYWPQIGPANAVSKEHGSEGWLINKFRGVTKSSALEKGVMIIVTCVDSNGTVIELKHEADGKPYFLDTPDSLQPKH